MSDKLCGLCQNSEGKYVCPTCNIFYCSVACYRSEKHLQCSELFYKKCVEEEMRFEKSSSHQIPSNEIVSALKRTENNFSNEPLDVMDNDEDDDLNGTYSDNDNSDEDENQGEEESEKDSDDDDDIAKRMEKVDLNDSNMLWEKLTAEERKEFLNMVSNGKIRKILPEWTPWWKFFKKKLIIDMECENESSIEDIECPSVDVLIPPLSEITLWSFRAQPPGKEWQAAILPLEILESAEDSYPWLSLHEGLKRFLQPLLGNIALDVIQNLHKLTKIHHQKKTPSENIPFMMVNILLAYACTARWFKGKHCDMPVEGITTLTALSDVLRNNKVFGSLVEACAEFENDLQKCQWLREENCSTLELIWEDVVDIVNGSKGQDSYFSVKACICDIRDMAEKALKILRNPIELKCFTGPKPTLRELKLLSKKMLYYLSWITSCGQILRSKISEGLG